MTNYFIVPGLGNSGPEHWQTYFEKSGDNFKRIIQQEWDAPHCEDWIETINKTISSHDPSTIILIVHSLGC
jgi:predicted alpha/beta hydrolase family esterase